MKRIRAVLMMLAMMIGLGAIASPAFAWHEDFPTTKAAIAAGNLWFQAPTPVKTAGTGLSALTVTVILSFVLPFLNGLITHINASKTLKGAVGMFLSAAAALVANAVGNDVTAFISQQVFTYAVLAFVIQLTTYLGFYRNIGDGGINNFLAPNAGIGRRTVHTDGSSWS